MHLSGVVSWQIDTSEVDCLRHQSGRVPEPQPAPDSYSFSPALRARHLLHRPQPCQLPQTRPISLYIPVSIPTACRSFNRTRAAASLLYITRVEQGPRVGTIDVATTDHHDAFERHKPSLNPVCDAWDMGLATQARRKC